MRRRYLKLWRSAIRHVIVDIATAKPVVALAPKGKKVANTEAPSTRVYARKEATKQTRKESSDTDKAKRVVEKETRLAVLAEHAKAKAEAVAAEVAAREARAEARRLGRQIGGC